MTTKRTLALTASAVTFFAISGAAYAGTVSVKKHHEANHRKLLMQAQKSPALDLASQEANGNNAHRYHGGPKSMDW
jgi:hypothetical protein